MNSLTRLWHETTARLKKPFREHSRTSMASGMEGDNTVVQLEQVRDRLPAAAQVETARIVTLERRLTDLETEHAATSRQLQVVEQELAVASADLGNTNTQVKSLAQQLEDGQQLYLQTVQETQLQLRKQDMRLNWLTLVSVFALLLAAVACVIFIWDVQKNAGLLASMSADIKELMITVEQQSGLSQPALKDRPAERPDMPRMQAAPADTRRSSIPSSTAQQSDAGNQAVTDILQTGDETIAGDAAPTDEVRQFFERNAAMPGMVSLPSGVQYRVVREGDGKSPGMHDWVVVDYLGMTPDGTIFDNTYDSGQRAIFGMNGLLPGWQEPLLQMQEGAEFEVYVPPGIANIGGISSIKKQSGEPGIYLIELIHVVAVGEDS
jgi:FKBP-type peptidyl-prolyl cis-trans isomerase